MLFVFIYIYRFPTLFPYQMIFVSFNRNTTSVTSGSETDYPSGAPVSIPGFQLGSCQSLVFCVVVRRSLFVLFLVVPLSSIYPISLPFWYLQTCLTLVLNYNYLYVVEYMESVMALKQMTTSSTWYSPIYGPRWPGFLY